MDLPVTAPLRSQPIRDGRILAGLLGRGILESRTPWLQEQEAEAHGLRMVYSLFDFSDRGWADADLGEVVTAAQRLGFAGLNVTFPFKQAVIPLLDGLSDAAAGIGAVNTIAFVDGRRIGQCPFRGATEQAGDQQGRQDITPCPQEVPSGVFCRAGT